MCVDVEMVKMTSVGLETRVWGEGAKHVHGRQEEKCAEERQEVHTVRKRL